MLLEGGIIENLIVNQIKSKNTLYIIYGLNSLLYML